MRCWQLQCWQLRWWQLRFWLTNYRRTWRGSIYSSVLNPLLFLGAIGLGLGSLVDAEAAHHGHGVHVQGDAGAAGLPLLAALDEVPDAIYIDPMYPQTRARKSARRSPEGYSKPSRPACQSS